MAFTLRRTRREEDEVFGVAFVEGKKWGVRRILKSQQNKRWEPRTGAMVRKRGWGVSNVNRPAAEGVF